MRLLIRLGFVPERVHLQAAADAPPDTPGKWFRANLDVKALLEIVALAGSLITMYTSAREHNQATDDRVAALQAQVEDNKSRLARMQQRISDETVSRATYEHDTNQLNLTLTSLQAGQQNIYQLLLEKQTAPAR